MTSVTPSLLLQLRTQTELSVSLARSVLVVRQLAEAAQEAESSARVAGLLAGPVAWERLAATAALLAERLTAWQANQGSGETQQRLLIAAQRFVGPAQQFLADCRLDLAEVNCI